MSGLPHRHLAATSRRGGDTSCMPTSVFNSSGPLSQPPLDFQPQREVARLGVGLPDREQIIDELMGIVASVRTFHLLQPDEVLIRISAYGARLTELAMRLQQVEGSDRQYTRIRTQQVERLQDELDKQFKTASRLVEISRQDLEMTR